MKKLWRILRMTGAVLILLLLVLITVGIIFLNTSPQFGQKPRGTYLERIRNSPNYADGQFRNPIHTTMGSFTEMMSTMPDFFFGKNREPENELPVKYGENESPAVDSLCYVTWYGHSAFLIEMEDRRILIDPMLGERPSPMPFGNSRFPNEEPIPVEDLTNIDMVILSHDHYDHLDYGTIMKLKDEVGHFYTALGVGSHLAAWGIPRAKITELDWWETATADNIQLISCPARHFSGRGITDRNSTQWASWVIIGESTRIYFSGDGGYGPHFSEIGEKYGPFDFAMMECGQYNQAWKDIHMMPEESVQAGIDVNAKQIMPIHWGAFALSVHTWKDPIERFKKKSQELNIPAVHPYIGQRFQLGNDFPDDEWWQ